MKSITIPFGEWLPDLPELGNQGATVVKNVIPEASSYRSLNSLSAGTNALDSACLGAIWAKSSAGNINNFAGDSGKLYKLTNATFSDVSKSGGYSGVLSWEFAKWGDRIIAVSLQSNTQYYDMESSALFADLAGSPPKANRIGVVRDFVVLGDLIEGGADYPSRVRWCGYNNSEIWGTDKSAQADYQDLRGKGGIVQKIVPGEYGLIFQEHSIWRMNYAGPPVIFQFDEIERGRGTPAPNSVCWTGERVFYWGHDGFYYFNGQVSQPLGNNRIDRFVQSDVDYSSIDKMRGAVDRENKLVFWSYPSNSGTGTADRLVIYNWGANKWGRAEINTDFIFENAEQGYNLDTLDNILSDIDTDSFNMESRQYLGGGINLAAFDSLHKLAGFTGTALDALIETGEYQNPNGRRVFISGVRPLVDGAAAMTVQIGERDLLTDSYAFGSKLIPNSVGICNTRKNCRYPRVRANITGGFNHAMGVEVFYKEEGRF